MIRLPSPLLGKAVGLIVFISGWEIAVRWTPSATTLLPAPSALPITLLHELQSGQLPTAWISSCSHTFLGVAIGAVFGILWGLAVARSPLFALLQSAAADLLRPVPPIAWIPFAIVWFGSGAKAAAFIVAIGVFWITYFTTLAAVRSINPTYYELAAAFQCVTPFQIMSRIILPAAAPGIMGGIRTSLGQGWTLVVAAELFGVPGIGQRMWEAAGMLANEVVIVYMLTIALSYALTDKLFLIFERRIFRWRQ